MSAAPIFQHFYSMNASVFAGRHGDIEDRSANHPSQRAIPGPKKGRKRAKLLRLFNLPARPDA